MRQAILVARSQHASASDAVPARPVAPEPDSTGCIDLTSDSPDSSDTGPEPIIQVLPPDGVCQDMMVQFNDVQNRSGKLL
jgi:hypothetical protein